MQGCTEVSDHTIGHSQCELREIKRSDDSVFRVTPADFSERQSKRSGRSIVLPD
ncbi:hypothetical Protein YC6258_00318 [Gynuella sunshinyii YC6258]|uniref:Uncharacterized protein n=1 Tax=Gynuella sunshinyii YC6258 TaxID=1445510 RepID=A0A0C5VG38_9GAMM|nr:hypothetical Protein YC6258_00318 [Gynuella sunshinyii YC6258]